MRPARTGSNATSASAGGTDNLGNHIQSANPGRKRQWTVTSSLVSGLKPSVAVRQLPGPIRDVDGHQLPAQSVQQGSRGDRPPATTAYAARFVPVSDAVAWRTRGRVRVTASQEPLSRAARIEPPVGKSPLRRTGTPATSLT